MYDDANGVPLQQGCKIQPSTQPLRRIRVVRMRVCTIFVMVYGEVHSSAKSLFWFVTGMAAKTAKLRRGENERNERVG